MLWIRQIPIGEATGLLRKQFDLRFTLTATDPDGVPATTFVDVYADPSAF